MKKLLIFMLVLGLTSMASAVPVLTAEKATINIGETIDVYVTGTVGTVLPDGPSNTYGGVLWTDYSDYVTTPYEDDPYLDLDVISGVIANAAGGAAQIGNVYNGADYGVNFVASPTVHGSGDIFQEADDVDVGLWFTFEVTGTAEGVTTLELWDISFSGVQSFVDITVIPEPITIALLGLGALFLRRRK